MKKIKKILVWFIVLDWLKINLGQGYILFRRLTTRGEYGGYETLRRIAPSWRDDVTFNAYSKEEKEVNE